MTLTLVLVLNALVRRSSDLFEFDQTHNAAMFSPSAKYLLYRYITPSFVGHSFCVEGESWYFFANSTLCILI